MIDCLELNGVSMVLGRLLMQEKSDGLESCERMYRSQWRTAPFPASDLDVATFEEVESGLRFELASKQMCTRPDQLADERAVESWYERLADIASSLPPAITGETLLVELTTYKGEGEGLAVFEQAKHLPIFISKQHSAELFNC